MNPKYIKELLQLTSKQTQIVLSGLKSKLELYKNKQILSYKYEVCPVCIDMKNDCDHCYIIKSCKAPFTDGFRDDPETGAAYFIEMQKILKREKE